MTKTLYDPEVERRGIEKGIKQGIEKGIKKVIEKMLIKGIGAEFICDILDVNIDIVNEVKVL